MRKHGWQPSYLDKDDLVRIVIGLHQVVALSTKTMRQAAAFKYTLKIFWYKPKKSKYERHFARRR